MSSWPRTEVELGRSVIRFLEEECWTIYPEVAIRGRTIDIVAKRGPLFMVVELKKVLGFGVIEQAMWAREYAHCIAIAVPRRFRRSGWGAASSLLKHEGIGLIEAGQSSAVTRVRPAILRKPPLINQLKAIALDPIQSTIEPGSNRGGYVTGFKRTCLRIAQYVAKHPGCPLNVAINKVEHHYAHDASARSALSNFIRWDGMPGVRYEKQGRKILLYPSQGGLAP